MIGRVSLSNFSGAKRCDGNELADALSPISICHAGRQTGGQAVSLRHKAGHRVPVQLHAFPIRDERGAVTAAAESLRKTCRWADWDRRQNNWRLYGCLDDSSGVLTHDMNPRAPPRGSRRFRGATGAVFRAVSLKIDRLEQIQIAMAPAPSASVFASWTNTREQLASYGFSGALAGKSVSAILMRVQPNRNGHWSQAGCSGWRPLPKSNGGVSH